MPVKRKGQKPILFGRIEPEPMVPESLKDNAESPQFSHYGSNARRSMEKMRYDQMKRFMSHPVSQSMLEMKRDESR